MIQKILFFCCLTIFFATSAQAQLYCRNETDKPIWLTLAYNYVPSTVQLVSDGDVWITEGWFYIPPMGVVQLTTHIGYHPEFGIKTNFFYYAEQVNGRDWYGARSFLIDTKAERSSTQLSFKIERAQSAFTYREVPQLQIRPFKGGTNTRESQYTIVLRPDDKNEDLVVHDENWDKQFENGGSPVIEFVDDKGK